MVTGGRGRLKDTDLCRMKTSRVHVPSKNCKNKIVIYLAFMVNDIIAIATKVIHNIFLHIYFAYKCIYYMKIDNLFIYLTLVNFTVSSVTCIIFQKYTKLMF